MRLLVLAILLFSSPAFAQDLPPADLAPVPVPVPVPDPTPIDLTTLPLGKGLPVSVRIAVSVVELQSLDETEQAFTATVDLRFRWSDPRLRDPSITGFAELRGAAADAYLATIWTPDVIIANLIDEPIRQLRGVRTFPDGTIELTERTAGTFASPLELGAFPFDRQELPIILLSERDHSEQVNLEYRQADLDSTSIARDARLDGFDIGFVELRRDTFPGWHGESHARLTAVIDIHRRPGKTIAVVFIPLLASLFIPLLAVWLNRVEDGEFKIEAFELTNIVIGGLFAVIALNFTISSEYPSIASGDNTVTRLLALNYCTLGVSLLVNLVLFRFGFVGRWFGKPAQEILFRSITWGLPLVAFACVVAFFMASMA